MISPINVSNVSFGKIFHVMHACTDDYEKSTGMRLNSQLISKNFADKNGNTLEKQLENAGYDVVLFYDSNKKNITVKAGKGVYFDEKLDALIADDLETISTFKSKKDEKNVLNLYENLKDPIENFLMNKKIDNIFGKVLHTIMYTALLLALSFVTFTAFKKCNPADVEKTLPGVGATMKNIVKM